jgi:hypothetical protein
LNSPLKPAAKAEKRVDGVWIIYVVGWDQRRVQRARQLGVEDMVKVIIWPELVTKSGPETEILVAYVV